MLDKDKNFDKELFNALEKEFAEPSADKMEKMRRKILADVPQKESFLALQLKNIITFAAVSAVLIILAVSSFKGTTENSIQNNKLSTMLDNEKQLDLMVAVLSDFTEEEYDNDLWEYVNPDNNWLLFETEDNGSLSDL